MDPVALVVLADPVALVDLRLPVARRHPILERKVLLPLPVDQADPVTGRSWRSRRPAQTATQTVDSGAGWIAPRLD